VNRILALLALALLLSGCGARHTANGDGSTLRIWYATDDPVERTWSQYLVRTFEASHRGLHARLTAYSFEDLNTKLQLALAAGNPPDLAYVTPRGPGIPAYVAAHRLLDLGHAAREHHWAAKLRPGLLADYNRPFTYFGARKGQVMAVPTALAGVGILYNKRLLRRLHLSVPDSMTAFEAALARAKGAGYTPIGMGNADGWLGDDWYLTLVNALVSPTSLASEQRLAPRFSFRRPPFIRAARLLKTWADKAYFTHDFGGLDAQEGVDVFFGGKTLFQLVSSSENSQILRDVQQTHLQVGVFAFPRKDAGRVMPITGYEGWVVPLAGKHPQQAIAFIDHLLSPVTAGFLLDQGILPAHRAALSAQPPMGPAQPKTFPSAYLNALATAQPGVYIDAAPVANLNATMEANVQLLLQGYEAPDFLVRSLQEVYTSHGSRGSTGRIDGEF
jgi:raffinose/stachyose/melibiose transport system substrate-binding protein